MSTYDDWAAKRVSEMLAVGLLPKPEDETSARALRSAGLRFHGKGLLQQASLPTGWTMVQQADQPMFVHLFDSQERLRAISFYKAIESRGYTRAEGRYWFFQPYTARQCAWDNGTDNCMYEPVATEYYEREEEVFTWLNRHYPNWRDPSSYWGDSKPWWRFW